jgi:uncharacterized protein (DUF697 family)
MARLRPLSVLGLLRELRTAGSHPGPIVVGGAPALAAPLREALARDGDPAAVRADGTKGAAALVYGLEAPPSAEDERVLKQAHRARVPIVCVLAPGLDAAVPYVLATDIVRSRDGAAPIEEVADVLAQRLGEEATSLAARLPALRGAVCDHLIATFSRRAGLVALAVFVPGADLPVITLVQLRLVLRIGLAHGVDVDRERLPEILAVVGSGFAFRAAARQALGVIPAAGWLVKGAVAYGGTRALGEAAVRYFAARSGDASVRFGS